MSQRRWEPCRLRTLETLWAEKKSYWLEFEIICCFSSVNFYISDYYTRFSPLTLAQGLVSSREAQNKSDYQLMFKGMKERKWWTFLFELCSPDFYSHRDIHTGEEWCQYRHCSLLDKEWKDLRRFCSLTIPVFTILVPSKILVVFA